MRGNEFLDSMEYVDADLIEAAEISSGRNSRGWLKWGALAACLCLLVLASVRFTGLSERMQPGSEELPMLSARLSEAGGMGFHGYQFYDISECDTGNPWNEELNLQTLPVYRNLSYVGREGYPLYYSEEEMLAMAEKAAGFLNSPIRETRFERIIAKNHGSDTKLKNWDGRGWRLHTKTDAHWIEIAADGDTVISFEEPQKLLEGTEIDDTDRMEAVRYFGNQYRELTGIGDFHIAKRGDRDYSGEWYTPFYFLYGKDPDPVQEILNYNFHRADFTFNEDGALTILGFCNLFDSAEKMGDYPLISTGEAKELLLAGEYFSDVPVQLLVDEKMQEAQIAKVELIYRATRMAEVFLPYYQFYVELEDRPETRPEGYAEGLKDFGIFYVPAVEGRYLSDFPLHHGGLY